jgi:transposase InsO family protein
MIARKMAGVYSTQIACEVLDLPRSTYYYQAQAKDEREVKAAIEQVALQWPTYGYRRIAHQLRRDRDWVINDKRVRRLMGEMGLQARKKRKKQRTTDSKHGYPRYPNLVMGLEIMRPDQVWVSDITYIRLLEEFVYLAIIMDVFTRSIRGWHLERHLGQELTLTALNHALLDRLPEIHHSDQGVQYAATAYVDLLHGYGVAISMADKGQAWQNGYAERVIRTIKEEEVELSDYQNYQDAFDQIGRFLDDVYMHKRIHSSLGYLTPAEFESQWLAQRNVKEMCP